MGKVLVSFDEKLPRQIDREAKSWGMTRSGYLAQLARDDLARVEGPGKDPPVRRYKRSTVRGRPRVRFSKDHPRQVLGQAPEVAARGIGSALIEFGLEQARESGTAMVLETGTQRNVPLYERLGFHVVEEADSPEGGPHVWFMRRDP